MPFEGRFYSTRGISLEPHPYREEGPPIWIGSWGSDAGMRRVARLGDILPTVNRPEDILRDRLPIGPPEVFIDKLREFASAGLQRAYIWPVADEARQLELFAEHVMPHI